MRYENIADIFSANEKIRERLMMVLGGTTDEERTARPDGEKWNIRQVVEHLSIVENGTMRICQKLLTGAKADGKQGDGSVSLNPTFGERSTQIAGMRVEAPDRVQPSGDQTIDESIEKLKEYREAIVAFRDDLESYDLSSHRFPHPFMGDLTAAEWLIVVGGHEARHTKQIERILSALRQ